MVEVPSVPNHSPLPTPNFMWGNHGVSLTNAIHSAYNEVPSLAYVDEVFEGQAWSWQANVEESTA